MSAHYDTDEEGKKHDTSLFRLIYWRILTNIVLTGPRDGGGTSLHPRSTVVSRIELSKAMLFAAAEQSM